MIRSPRGGCESVTRIQTRPEVRGAHLLEHLHLLQQHELGFKPTQSVGIRLVGNQLVGNHLGKPFGKKPAGEPIGEKNLSKTPVDRNLVGMIVLFHVSQFTFRGTEVAVFDYANYAETILRHTSIIVTPGSILAPSSSDESVRSKFAARFPIVEYSSYRSVADLGSLDWTCKHLRGDVLYTIKYGTRDQIESRVIPTVVHCVFTASDPHGLVYAGVSESVHKSLWVPHIVWFPDEPAHAGTSFRSQLSIPSDAVVFGRHGGDDTFDLGFVHDTVVKIARACPSIYFLFAVRPRIFSLPAYPSNIIFCAAFSDLGVKQRFIQTCDAMIHACSLGESFGLSVLEFAYFSKPVVTWTGGSMHRQHLAHLGSRAMTYSNASDLESILVNFRATKRSMESTHGPGPAWTIRSFSPNQVMARFQSVFLDPVRSAALQSPETLSPASPAALHVT